MRRKVLAYGILGSVACGVMAGAVYLELGAFFLLLVSIVVVVSAVVWALGEVL